MKQNIQLGVLGGAMRVAGSALLLLVWAGSTWAAQEPAPPPEAQAAPAAAPPPAAAPEAMPAAAPVATAAPAPPAAAPTPTGIVVSPAEINLATVRDRQSLVVQLNWSNGLTSDATTAATFQIADPAYVKSEGATF